MDQLVLSGIQAAGVHGVLQAEKERSQPFEVDLVIESDLARAGRSDDLSDAIDYSLIAAEAARIVREESFDLIEALAARIAQAVLADSRVATVEVEVRKLRPEVEARLAYAAVRIRRTNS